MEEAFVADADAAAKRAIIKLQFITKHPKIVGRRGKNKLGAESEPVRWRGPHRACCICVVPIFAAYISLNVCASELAS